MEIFVTREGQKHGPYTVEQAQAYLQQGQLSPNDLAWKEGMGEWQPLSQVLGLDTALPPGAPPPPPRSSTPGNPAAGMSDNTMAMLAHLLGIFTGFLGPLIIWLVKKDDSKAEFVIDQAKEALNFQITVTIAFCVCFVLSFVLIGFLVMPVVIIGNLVFCIIAALKANEGVAYRYPVTLRLVK